MLDNAPVGRIRVGCHLACPGRKADHRHFVSGRSTNRSQVLSCRHRRARGRHRILSRVPFTHTTIGLGTQLRVNPAKRLAQIRIHVGIGLTQHAVAAKGNDVRDLRQEGGGLSRRLGTHHQLALVHRFKLLAVIRLIRQLNRHVAKVTVIHTGRSGGRIRRNSSTRALGILHRRARAIDSRDPGAIASQRRAVLRQLEHQVLAGQRDHPIHLHTVGRVDRPLVDNASRAQNIGATQQVKTITYNRGVGAGGGASSGQTGAVQIGEIKAVQITRDEAVLLVGDGGHAEKVRDMHRVVAEFNPRGVIADKVRHLQHVARIDVGISTTGSNDAVSGARERTLMRRPVVLDTRIGRAIAIGKEVRAHRFTIEWR